MTDSKKAILAVALGNSIFGFSFLFSKIALDHAIPSLMVAMRFTTAFVVMNIIVCAGTLIKKRDGQSLISFSLRGKPLKYVFLLALFQPILYFIGESYIGTLPLKEAVKKAGTGEICIIYCGNGIGYYQGEQECGKPPRFLLFQK